ncbi:MAG: BolA family protein [Sphingomonadales bacterium]
MDNYHARIETKLQAAFAPVSLKVIDQSDQHAGHAGAREGGQTHFMVVMVSEAFVAKGRVERQRMVYRTLDSELEERVHALSLKLRTPDEEAAKA